MNAVHVLYRNETESVLSQPGFGEPFLKFSALHRLVVWRMERDVARDPNSAHHFGMFHVSVLSMLFPGCCGMCWTSLSSNGTENSRPDINRVSSGASLLPDAIRHPLDRERVRKMEKSVSNVYPGCCKDIIDRHQMDWMYTVYTFSIKFLVNPVAVCFMRSFRGWSPTRMFLRIN